MTSLHNNNINYMIFFYISENILWETDEISHGNITFTCLIKYQVALIQKLYQCAVANLSNHFRSLCMIHVIIVFSFESILYILIMFYINGIIIIFCCSYLSHKTIWNHIFYFWIHICKTFHVNLQDCHTVFAFRHFKIIIRR